MSNVLTKPIGCLDLKQQHEQIKQEVFEKFEDVYANTAFSGGKFAEEFEERFAEFCHANYAIALNSGTSALHLALLALGIKEGDEVILPANTFIATAWAVSYVNATPVFVDCDPKTWEIDCTQIEDKITDKTKLIIGVHLYGQPFDVHAVKQISKKYNIPFIEDAAQAHGATYNDQVVGTFGEMACFSFYPGKNLGACGEGGGIITQHEAYANHLKRLRNHGCSVRYYHDELGFNMRIGGLEAASLTVKLKYLADWNKRRQEIAKRYQTEVTNRKITMQHQPEDTSSVYHLFVVTVENREEFTNYLKEHSINVGLHYPVPCHLQKAYAHLGHQKGDFPNSEYLSEHCVSLPMYAELTDEEVDHVIQAINNY